METKGKPVADRGNGRVGGLYGGSRYLHRKCCTSTHCRRPRRQHQPRYLGTNQLSCLQRDHPPGWCMGVERYRPQEFLSAVEYDLHCGKLFLWYRADTPDLAFCTCPSGRRRGWPPANGAGYHGGFVRTEETGPGIRALRSRRCTCAVPRTDDRRLDHGQLFVAMDLLYQSACWHTRLLSGEPSCSRPTLDRSRPLQPQETGLHRLESADHFDGWYADHAR